MWVYYQTFKICLSFSSQIIEVRDIVRKGYSSQQSFIYEREIQRMNR